MQLVENTTRPGADPIPLAQLGRGQFGRIARCETGGCCASLLESLGLDMDAVISVCQHGDPCIVRVHTRCGGSCRIGLRRDLSRSIFVTPAPDLAR